MADNSSDEDGSNDYSIEIVESSSSLSYALQPDCTSNIPEILAENQNLEIPEKPEVEVAKSETGESSLPEAVTGPSVISISNIGEATVEQSNEKKDLFAGDTYKEVDNLLIEPSITSESDQTLQTCQQSELEEPTLSIKDPSENVKAGKTDPLIDVPVAPVESEIPQLKINEHSRELSNEVTIPADLEEQESNCDLNEPNPFEESSGSPPIIESGFGDNVTKVEVGEIRQDILLDLEQIEEETNLHESATDPAKLEVSQVLVTDQLEASQETPDKPVDVEEDKLKNDDQVEPLPSDQMPEVESRVCFPKLLVERDELVKLMAEISLVTNIKTMQACHPHLLARQPDLIPEPTSPNLCPSPEVTIQQPEIVSIERMRQELTDSLIDSVDYGAHLAHLMGPQEDLESEFDNETEFEARQVQVKKGQDLRAEYKLCEEIGRGQFGTVFKCVELTTDRKLAAKFIHMGKPQDRQDVEREISIMSQLQHRRLLQLYDAFDDGQNEMCLVTELVEGGELFERIVDDDFELTEKKAAIFMRQICEGVDYMQTKQIVHLDMKPENILCVSKTGNRIKLIDFGLARKLDPEQPLRVMFGTPDFAAPEVLGYEEVSLSTDMWSVGVICYILLSGLMPFMGDTDMETIANVTRATFDFEAEPFELVSDLAKEFISKLLVKDQTKRLKPIECLKHPWLARGGVQLEASLHSSRRNSCIGVLQQIQLAAAGDLSMVANLAQDYQMTTPPLGVLDKRHLKKYVVRRKWHKTVHAIMALTRMGANLKSIIT